MADGGDEKDGLAGQLGAPDPTSEFNTSAFQIRQMMKDVRTSLADLLPWNWIPTGGAEQAA